MCGGSLSANPAGSKTPRLDSAARKISEFFPSKPQLFCKRDTYTQVCVCVCVGCVCVCVWGGCVVISMRCSVVSD